MGDAPRKEKETRGTAVGANTKGMWRMNAHSKRKEKEKDQDGFSTSAKKVTKWSLAEEKMKKDRRGKVP